MKKNINRDEEIISYHYRDGLHDNTPFYRDKLLGYRKVPNYYDNHGVHIEHSIVYSVFPFIPYKKIKE